MGKMDGRGVQNFSKGDRCASTPAQSCTHWDQAPVKSLGPVPDLLWALSPCAVLVPFLTLEGVSRAHQI